jgi:invasion protein IalB
MCRKLRRYAVAALVAVATFAAAAPAVTASAAAAPAGQSHSQPADTWT